MGVVLYGGVFDPPHLGHVEVVRAAKRRFGAERLVVFVASRPGHKAVAAPIEDRLALARAAFPGELVEVDEYPRTIDRLRAERYEEPVFVIGADELVDFPSWKEPDEVLALTRLAVATRPGFPPPAELLERYGGRIEVFEIEPVPVASRDVRQRAGAGESLEGLVPEAVERLIRERGLYGAG